MDEDTQKRLIRRNLERQFERDLRPITDRYDTPIMTPHSADELTDTETDSTGPNHVSHYSLNEGDTVCTPSTRGTRLEPRYKLDDGWVYGEAITTNPDSDNEIKVTLLNQFGEPFMDDGSEMTVWFPAEELFRPADLPWEADHTSDVETGDETDLTPLEDEQECFRQMQELRARTVEPGLLQLPVAADGVATASNSSKWTITAEHPVLGDLDFRFEKPLAGWSDEYEIVEFLESYGIMDGNPYKLQQQEVYVEFTGDDATNNRAWDLRSRDEIVDRDDEDEAGEGDEEEDDKPMSREGTGFWTGVASAALMAGFIALNYPPAVALVVVIVCLFVLYVLANPSKVEVATGTADTSPPVR